MANLRKIVEKPRITLREKSHREFAIPVSRETGSSRMVNKIANRAYKARADWLNNFYSPRECKGHKVVSQNDQLRPTWNLIWASLRASII